MKVLIVGIDGGTYDLIEPWVKRGELPTLGKMMKDGMWGNLITTYPPLTGPAWVSMTTGCNPGKHGVFDFMAPEIGKVRINNASAVKVPKLWEILSENNVRLGFVNVPMTYPPVKVNGYMITGIMSGKGDISYPPTLKTELETAIGRNYKVGIEVPPQKGREEGHIKEIHDWHDSISKSALYVLQKEPLDFFMVVFNITDAASHSYYENMENDDEYGSEILKSYQVVDQSLNEILKFAGPETNTLLVSDHGFGPLRGMININNFLVKRGIIKFRKKARFKNFLFQHGITPKNLYNLMKKLKLAGLARSASQEKRGKVLSSFLGFSDIDMDQTLAYSRGHVGQIHINRQALEKNKLDLLEVREKVIRELFQMKDPHGKVITSQILTREEMYNGPFIDMGPDMFIVLDDYNYIAYPLFAADNKIVTKHIINRSGTHRMNGMFLGRGPYFHDQGRTSDRKITDITPTVLDILGINIPDYMDGKPIK